MFELISSDKLVPGTKYRIVKNYSGRRVNGIFQRTCIEHNKIYLTFDKLYDETLKVEITINWYFHPCDKFYTFVSQNPQWKMERRSVNLIVRRLIGDDCFTW